MTRIVDSHGSLFCVREDFFNFVFQFEVDHAKVRDNVFNDDKISTASRSVVLGLL